MTSNKLGVVCCYYNPCNYKSKYNNFIKFYNNLPHNLINLKVIELRSDYCQLNLPDYTNSHIFETKTPIWHKENLINIGIKLLIKDKCEYISWLDADIIFDSKSWVENTIKCLDKYNICQLFSSVYTFNSKQFGCAYTFKNTKEPTIGKTGYGWACKSEILAFCNLYDKAIIGGGDSLAWIASLNSRSLSKQHPIHSLNLSAYSKNFLDWSKLWGSLIDRNIGYINNSITALNHGSFRRRRYLSRYSILEKNSYNPYIDIEYKNKIIHCKNQTLASDISNYFYRRKEDRLIF